MPDESAGPAPRQEVRDLEEMWTALLACGWNLLAVVPTDHGISVQPVVDALRATSGAANPPVSCIDARGADIAEAKRLAEELAAAISRKSRAVVVVDSLMGSLSGVHLVQGANSVLLVVRIGGMDLDSLTGTVAIVGSERVVGSVTAPVGP